MRSIGSERVSQKHGGDIISQGQQDTFGKSKTADVSGRTDFSSKSGFSPYSVTLGVLCNISELLNVPSQIRVKNP